MGSTWNPAWVSPSYWNTVDTEEDVIDIKDKSKNIYDEGKEAECPNDTPPAEIEESVGDINDDNNEDNYEGKEAGCLDDTYHEDMEEGVRYKK